MTITLADTKTALEISAYICGVAFLLTKLIGGQANAGMEVSIELARVESTSNPELDSLSILLKLKRPDLGRIEIDDVLVEVSDPRRNSEKPVVLRSSRVVSERAVDSGKISDAVSDRGLTLPPSDATQVAYFTEIKRGVPILIDATVLATRTGFWIGKPQWRASAIALPIAPVVSAVVGETGG